MPNVGLLLLYNMHVVAYSTVNPNHPSHTLLHRIFPYDHNHPTYQHWVRADQAMHLCSSAQTRREPLASSGREKLLYPILKKGGPGSPGRPRVIVSVQDICVWKKWGTHGCGESSSLCYDACVKDEGPSGFANLGRNQWDF